MVKLFDFLALQFLALWECYQYPNKEQKELLFCLKVIEW